MAGGEGWDPLVTDDVPDGFGGLIVVEAGHDPTEGSSGITVTWRWGIDGTGDPYFDLAGVTAGEEAALVVDPDTGTYSLVSVTV